MSAAEHQRLRGDRMNPEDTFTHTEDDARRYARSTTDHDPRVGVDGDTYDAAVEEH